MLPYILLIGLILVIGINGRKKINLQMIFFLLFIFSAIRFMVGTDFITYFKVSSGQIDINTNNYMLFEPLNILLINVGYFINSSQFFFISSACITMLFFYKGISEQSSDYFVSAICFIGFPMFFLESLSIVRQFLAISIVFYSIKFIENKKPFTFIFYVLLASMFHFTALLTLIMYFVKIIDFNRWKNLMMLSFSWIAGVLFTMFLRMLSGFSKIDYYINYNSDGYFFVFIGMIAIATINIIFYERLLKKNKKNKILLDLFNLGLCTFLFFRNIPVIAGRFSFFFLILLVLIIPEYYLLFKQKRIVRITLITTFTILFFIRIWYSSYLVEIGRMQIDPHIPYQVYFNKNL